ncbi:4396_t:CDS:2 [Acaulospora morrowiae]|uniref:4396_t:CDS:1 n=1 Tax=Acaulospora morrowiae TaxID=94023 RepID=A0A9N8VP75_9GLOM|nr:4396_t:CDS:2 [Acaulospora morrowiae]
MERLLEITAAPAVSPCSKFGSYVKGEDYYVPVPMDEVRSCLTSFSYNSTAANEIVDSIIKALTGYYVFLDSARDPPNPGNTYNEIDIVSALKAVLQGDFKTDYDFMINVTNTLDQLKDAHTGLFPSCYDGFTYIQGLDLYSIVDSNGHQSIKVWKDFIDNSNSECDVLFIDGIPAIQAIKQYARDDIGLVRDLGVRFNMALTALTAGGTSEFSNYFTRRQYLPPSDKITYTLKCNGVTKKVIRKWTACGSTEDLENVTSAEKYWVKNCAPSSGFSDLSKTRKSQYRKLFEKLTPQILKTSQTNNICRIIDSSVPNPVKLSHAQLLLDEFETKFYYLPEQDTGVITMTEVDVTNFMKGFQKFIDKGVKKIILDLTGNSGGSIFAAHDLNKLLFPKTDPYFNTDFRVSDLLRLSIQNSKSPNTSITYPGLWIDPQTKKPFKNAKSFIGNNEYTRGGVTEHYTSQLIENDNPLSAHVLPWKATDYVILSNGFCGSSCSLIATHLAEENNILTVSVGGFANTPMAFASFSGGQVYGLYRILKEQREIGLGNNSLAPQPLPVYAELTFAIREAYSKSNPEEVLEFSYRPAAKRLYYDNISARDPSELWEPRLKGVKVLVWNEGYQKYTRDLRVVKEKKCNSG